MSMNQDIFIVTRSSGEWESAYTQSLFYVTSKAEANKLAQIAKEEWLAAMNIPIPNLDRPDDTGNWTDQQWMIFNDGEDEAIADVMAKRQAALTIDPNAPLEDSDVVSYGVSMLSPRKES
jgi:hypothetical protein